MTKLTPVGGSSNGLLLSDPVLLILNVTEELLQADSISQLALAVTDRVEKVVVALHHDSLGNEMNGGLGHDSALQGYTGPGTTLANEMNFGMNHASCAGLIATWICSPACYHYATSAPCGCLKIVR